MRPLIPRRTLFGNPTFLNAQVSPDGSLLSWIAPVDGVLNIWVAPRGDLASAAPVTRTKGRPIFGHNWTHDGRHVLFTKDETGDENVHLFAAEVRTGDLRDLTPLPQIAAHIRIMSPDRPAELIVALNDRDARWHDLHAIDIATGARRLVWENSQELAHVGFDWTHTPRWARSALPGGGARLWRIEAGKLVPWRDIAHADSLQTWPMMFNRANTHLHLRSTIDRDKAAFMRIDWAKDGETVVAAHPNADVWSVLFDTASFEITAAGANTTRLDWFYQTQSVSADFSRLAEHLPSCELGIDDQTHSDRHWIVSAHKPEQPFTYYHYDRDDGTLSELGCARAELKPYRLAPMRIVETKARDGLDLVSYLTLPADVLAGKPTTPLPMVLLVHGGPWARDNYAFRSDHQWLADRGYAVLSVNYRGSLGFGKSFVEASVHEHAGRMHDDLIDVVRWAIREGIADPAKVAIHGASYGGYASFVGATFTPEQFCCSVPVVGITNVQTLIESIPPYWAGFAEEMYRSYGDPRTEAGRALMASRSPIHKVDRIVKPMLILHGANDVRCKIAESDTIVAAMTARNIPVTYVVYPDEGHGFAKPANRIASSVLIEQFFARVLGGACEPVGADFDGSSHQIRVGADLLG